jgi:hypothetical protein
MMDAKQVRRAKLQRVREAWDKAPATIRVMAGPYVVPIMDAMEAMGQELDTVCTEGVRCHGDQCAAGQLACPTPAACGVKQ